MLGRIMILLAGSAACIAAPALAQESKEEVSHQVLRERLSYKADAIAGGASNDATLSRNTTPSLQFLASDDDKVASLGFTLDLKPKQPKDAIVDSQASFTASSKLDDSGDAKVLGLKGFAKGTEIKAAYTHFSARLHLTGTPDTTQEKVAIENCKASPEGKAGTVVCDPASYNPNGASAFVAHYNREGYPEYLGQFAGLPTFYGVEIAGNQAGYNYLDRTAFATKSESHFGYKGTLFGGGLFSGKDGSQTSITGSYTWGRAYNENDEITLCQPLAGGVQSQCLTAKDGAPGKQDLSIFSLEIRYAFGAEVGEYAKAAIAPEFSYDVESEAYSVTLPVYLVGDDKGKLRGGVRAVYLNEKQPTGGRDDAFTLGVFVGVPFTLFSH
jgi:hypothetical protein